MSFVVHVCDDAGNPIEGAKVTFSDPGWGSRNGRKWRSRLLPPFYRGFRLPAREQQVEISVSVVGMDPVVVPAVVLIVREGSVLSLDYDTLGDNTFTVEGNLAGYTVRNGEMTRFPIRTGGNGENLPFESRGGRHALSGRQGL